jgi:hypothetical protein
MTADKPASLTSDRVRRAIIVLLMVSSVAAGCLLLVGAVNGNHSVKGWGKVLAIPALLAIGVPVLGGYFLALYWGFRYAVRSALPSVWKRRQIEIAEVYVDPTQQVSPRPPITLTDDEAFGYLMAGVEKMERHLGVEHRHLASGGQAGADNATQDPQAGDEPTDHTTAPDGAPSPVWTLEKLPDAQGLVCYKAKRNDNGNVSYFVQISTREGAIDEAEAACMRIIRERNPSSLLVDARRLTVDHARRFCDFLVRIRQAAAATVIRVAQSWNPADVIMPLHHAVTAAVSGKEAVARVFTQLYLALFESPSPFGSGFA